MSTKNLNSYFSSSAIINLLCKYRIKCATKGRKKQVLRNITSIPEIKEKLQYTDPFFETIRNLLPPRSEWLRPRFTDRKHKDSNQIAIESIRRRIKVTHYEVVANGEKAPEWYEKLQDYIHKIQNKIQDIESLSFEPPSIIPEVKKRVYNKDKKGIKETICRPISVFNLDDRIIIGLTAKYLIVLFEKIFLPYSYAFKPIKYTGTGVDVIKHHHAIKDILRYRIAQYDKKIWVSECDINKFFDTVNHKLTFSIFENGLMILQNQGYQVDDRVRKIFKEYLACYSFKSTISPLNSNQKYFDDFNIQKGRFEIPLKRMVNKFYPRHKKLKDFIGIPQGGAISCFIANLLLHEADKEIQKLKEVNEDLFYCRYCDDMMIISPAQKDCDYALLKYRQTLRKMQLLVHAPVKIVDYTTHDKNNRSAALFWDFKSKESYCWDSNIQNKSNIPWIGFVGYQIKFNGNIRVRKSSLEKELKKQKKIYSQTLRIINANEPSRLNVNCKKSKLELISSVSGRLNAMSVGKCSIYDAYDKKNQNFCWLNGFSELTRNPSTICQLKKLDRSRNRFINKLQEKLSGLTKKSKPTKTDSKKNVVKYYGYPFSYAKVFDVK